MVNYAVWAEADPLTVEQAACLWAGIEPTSLVPDFGEKHLRDAQARLQMLSGAIHAGHLKADSSLNSLAALGDFSASLVLRADLAALATGRAQRPPFLFDCIFPEKTKPPVAAQLKPSRGRPAEWDWDTFYLEIVRIADGRDGLPDTQAALAEAMRDWFILHFDNHPSDTTLEDRIRPIYRYLEQHRQDATHPRKFTGRPGS